jgi:hypothetical protein
VIGGAGTYRERVVPRFRPVMQKHAAATTPPPDPERLKRIAFQIDGRPTNFGVLANELATQYLGVSSSKEEPPQELSADLSDLEKLQRVVEQVS